MAMELPDEAVVYQFQSLLAPVVEDWTAAAELRTKHFVSPNRLRDLTPRLLQCRSQVAAEREMRNVPPELLPLALSRRSARRSRTGACTNPTRKRGIRLPR